MSVDPRVNAIGRATPAPAKLRGEVAANLQPPALYAAIQRTVFHCGLPVKALADQAGLPYSRVTDIANPTQQKPLRVTDLLALVLASGKTDIVDWLEGQIGRVAFTFPTSIEGKDAALHAELTRNVTAFGALLEQHGTALADGVLESHEVAGIEQALDVLDRGPL